MTLLRDRSITINDLVTLDSAASSLLRACIPLRHFSPHGGIYAQTHGLNLDCILQFGTSISDSCVGTLMCIGKLMVHTLFLKRVKNFNSKL